MQNFLFGFDAGILNELVRRLPSKVKGFALEGKEAEGIDHTNFQFPHQRSLCGNVDGAKPITFRDKLKFCFEY